MCCSLFPCPDPYESNLPVRWYHVTSRGDGREAIFLSEADRHRFLDVMSKVVQDCHWAMPAYCLMDNHYHLVVETPDGNLSKGMRQLNGVYTQCFNRQHGRVGHVFQGRYKAIIGQRSGTAVFLRFSRNLFWP